MAELEIHHDIEHHDPTGQGARNPDLLLAAGEQEDLLRLFAGAVSRAFSRLRSGRSGA
jgi:hypothetical protein